jgi:hypothetical protein
MALLKKKQKAAPVPIVDGGAADTLAAAAAERDRLRSELHQLDERLAAVPRTVADPRNAVAVRAERNAQRLVKMQQAEGRAVLSGQLEEASQAWREAGRAALMAEYAPQVDKLNAALIGHDDRIRAWLEEGERLLAAQQKDAAVRTSLNERITRDGSAYRVPPAELPTVRRPMAGIAMIANTVKLAVRGLRAQQNRRDRPPTYPSPRRLHGDSARPFIIKPGEPPAPSLPGADSVIWATRPPRMRRS